MEPDTGGPAQAGAVALMAQSGHRQGDQGGLGRKSGKGPGHLWHQSGLTLAAVGTAQLRCRSRPSTAQSSLTPMVDLRVLPHTVGVRAPPRTISIACWASSRIYDPMY